MENCKMPVLAIYAIRGIQDYIFRTPKISTAMELLYWWMSLFCDNVAIVIPGKWHEIDER